MEQQPHPEELFDLQRITNQYKEQQDKVPDQQQQQQQPQIEDEKKAAIANEIDESELVKPAPLVGDKRFLHKYLLMIHCAPTRRSQWAPTEWSEPKTFVCDHCLRYVENKYRLSWTDQQPTEHAGKQIWKDMRGSFCSASCAHEHVLAHEVNHAQVLPLMTLMFKAYGIDHALPPCASERRLQMFNTKLKGVMTPEQFDATLTYPKHAAKNCEFHYRKEHQSVQMLTWPGADPNAAAIRTQEEDSLMLPSSKNNINQHNEFESASKEGLNAFYDLARDDDVEEMGLV